MYFDNHTHSELAPPLSSASVQLHCDSKLQMQTEGLVMYMYTVCACCTAAINHESGR